MNVALPMPRAFMGEWEKISAATVLWDRIRVIEVGVAAALKQNDPDLGLELAETLRSQ